MMMFTVFLCILAICHAAPSTEGSGSEPLSSVENPFDCVKALQHWVKAVKELAECTHHKRDCAKLVEAVAKALLALKNCAQEKAELELVLNDPENPIDCIKALRALNEARKALKKCQHSHRDCSKFAQAVKKAMDEWKKCRHQDVWENSAEQNEPGYEEDDFSVSFF